MRTAKLKTSASIGGSAAHNWRENYTPNVDPNKTPLNTTTGAQSSAELLAAVQSRLSTVHKVRTNGVLVVEYFIGASPEFFKLKPDQVENYFDRSEKWLKDKYGAENVIAVTRQYDETSPHICAYVVPIDERGKLYAGKFLNGKKKLSELQTDFTVQCGEPFGLMRGIEGSKAKHIECSEYYARVNSKTPAVTTQIPADRRPTLTENLMSATGLNNDYADLQKRRKKAIAEREAEEKDRQIALEAKAKQFEMERDASRKRDAALADLRANSATALADLRANLADLRANSAQLREIPLVDVLRHLGCQPDPADAKNWITRAGRLTIDGRKFYLHDLGNGGAGAIDLVKAVEDTDYAGALRILSDCFGVDATVAHEVARTKTRVEQIVATSAPFVPPSPSPKNWPKVRNYLTITRALAGDLIDKLNQTGKVYADKFANAVFVLGANEGVALHGTGALKLQVTRGQKVPFTLGGVDLKEVVFTDTLNDFAVVEAGDLSDAIAFDLVTTGRINNLVLATEPEPPSPTPPSARIRIRA